MITFLVAVFCLLVGGAGGAVFMYMYYGPLRASGQAAKAAVTARAITQTKEAHRRIRTGRIIGQ